MNKYLLPIGIIVGIGVLMLLSSDDAIFRSDKSEKNNTLKGKSKKK